MFSWLAILRLVLVVAEGVLKYVSNKQLMEAGEAKAAARALEESNKIILRALAARRIATADPVLSADDPYNRDRDNKKTGGSNGGA